MTWSLSTRASAVYIRIINKYWLDSPSLPVPEGERHRPPCVTTLSRVCPVFLGTTRLLALPLAAVADPGNYEMRRDTRGRRLISLWLYKENNKLRDWKKCIYSTYSPLSSTHLWLRCSNFFNPSKENSFGCAANRKIWNRKSQILISTPTYLPYAFPYLISLSVFLFLCLLFSVLLSFSFFHCLLSVFSSFFIISCFYSSPFSRSLFRSFFFLFFLFLFLSFSFI
jgi:hypothetical protein